MLELTFPPFFYCSRLLAPASLPSSSCIKLRFSGLIARSRLHYHSNGCSDREDRYTNGSVLGTYSRRLITSLIIGLGGRRQARRNTRVSFSEEDTTLKAANGLAPSLLTPSPTHKKGKRAPIPIHEKTTSNIREIVLDRKLKRQAITPSSDSKTLRASRAPTSLPNWRPLISGDCRVDRCGYHGSSRT